MECPKKVANRYAYAMQIKTRLSVSLSFRCETGRPVVLENHGSRGLGGAPSPSVARAHSATELINFRAYHFPTDACLYSLICCAVFSPHFFCIRCAREEIWRVATAATAATAAPVATTTAMMAGVITAGSTGITASVT